MGNYKDEVLSLQELDTSEDYQVAGVSLGISLGISVSIVSGALAVSASEAWNSGLTIGCDDGNVVV